MASTATTTTTSATAPPPAATPAIAAAVSPPQIWAEGSQSFYASVGSASFTEPNMDPVAPTATQPKIEEFADVLTKVKAKVSVVKGSAAPPKPLVLGNIPTCVCTFPQLESWFAANRLGLYKVLRDMLASPDHSWFIGTQKMFALSVREQSRSKVPLHAVPLEVYDFCLDHAPTFECLPFTLTGLAGNIAPYKEMFRQKGQRSFRFTYMKSLKAKEVTRKNLKTPTKSQGRPRVVLTAEDQAIMDEYANMWGITLNAPRESVFFGKLLIAPATEGFTYRPFAKVLYTLKPWTIV
jgi:hypothetical protein